MLEIPTPGEQAPGKTGFPEPDPGPTPYGMQLDPPKLFPAKTVAMPIVVVQKCTSISLLEYISVRP